MKRLLATGLCLLSLAAFADNHEEGEGKNFEENKAKMLQNIDSKISHLNEMKSCVSSAADREAAKKCREKMKEHREEMKEHREEMKEKWQDKKKEMKEKRKKK